MATILKATIERPARANAVTFNNIAVAQEQPSLDAAQSYLEKFFTAEKGWFVYRGGHHVSLHRHTSTGSVMGPRVAIIEERAS